MFIRVFDEPKLADPVFLSYIREGMTNGWSDQQMKDMGISSPQKHAYIRKLSAGGTLLYKAPDQLILYTSQKDFDKSCAQVMKYIKDAHVRLCSGWIESHIDTLLRDLEGAVYQFLEDNDISKDSIDSDTLEKVYNGVEIEIKEKDYPLLKKTKTDLMSRVNVSKQLGLLDNPKIAPYVPEEAHNRIKELLFEL